MVFMKWCTSCLNFTSSIDEDEEEERGKGEPVAVVTEEEMKEESSRLTGADSLQEIKNTEEDDDVDAINELIQHENEIQYNRQQQQQQQKNNTRMKLNPTVGEVSPQDYEVKWREFTQSITKLYELKDIQLDLEKLLARNYIYTLASGQPQDDSKKLYLYAEELNEITGNNLFLLEVLVRYHAREVQVRVKTSIRSAQLIAHLEQHVFLDALIPKQIQKKRRNKSPLPSL